ncbi:MAG: diaminopimelate decarboxylase [Syntrophomonas sp.]
MYLTGTMKINNLGHLEVGKVDTVDLVKEFGTPLWAIDEEGMRGTCRKLRDAFLKFGDSLVIYASKTLSTQAVYKIVEQEGLGLDVVSGGELYTALKAGFPMEKVYFHGNNKSREEIEMAVKAGVGRIVADNFYELELLNSICMATGKIQDILLRITPGVEAHTHEYIKTGQIDSKFGFTLADGQAMEGVKIAVESPYVNPVGLHCHIGSQIFEMESFEHAASIMMEFLGEVKKATAHEFDELDVGGGFGIYYFPGDEPRDPEDWARAVMLTVKGKAEELGIKMPRIIVEPGRAIAGPAGITLYTLGSSKEVTGIRKYVAVDGGMTDNPRPALYGSKYIAIIANKGAEEPVETVSIAGKCCESGDMLIWDARLPKVEAGDILAVFATGAYNYSMSSNYNRLPKPAMVLVGDGKADLIIKRENYEDLIRNDLIPERLK